MNPFRAHPALSILAIALAIAFSAHANDYDEVDHLRQAGRFDEAMKQADQVLASNPRDAQMRFLKGVVQIDSGKTTDAIATFTRLTQDDPALPEPYNNLAVLYAGQGQYDKARAALESAIRTNPSYSTAHENLGDVYARLASQAYGKALQFDPSNTAIAPKLAAVRTVENRTASDGTRSGGEGKTILATAALPAPATAAAALAVKGPPSVVSAAPVALPPAHAPQPASAKPSTRPPVATPPVPSPDQPAAGTATGEVESAVRAWAGAWSAQNLNGYLGAYAGDFKPASGQSRKAWEEERRARIVGKSSISVNVQNLAVIVQGDTAIARFRQSYRADALNVDSRKTLELVRQGGGWKIAKETVGG